METTYQLTKKQDFFQKNIDTFVKQKITPRVKELDQAEEFPPEEAGPSKVDISVVLLCENYNQPVSIELPPEAEEALEM